MTLRTKIYAGLFVAMIVSLAAIACGGATQADIIQTTQAQTRNENATATAKAGGAGGAQVGEGSQADLARQASYATSTARALEAANATPTVAGGSDGMAMPDGPALTDADNPTVNIGDRGTFDPEVIKVKVGTTVTWTNDRHTASSTKSLDGESEEWNSGPLSKGVFATEPATFTHTFTVPGCHQYGSFEGGDRSRGYVCVAE